MNLFSASNYDLFAASVDGEYQPHEIKAAAEALDIPEGRILGISVGFSIINWIEDNRKTNKERAAN